MDRIILVEPICRGSRLQILTNTIEALASIPDVEIVLVTRPDYRNDHFEELLSEYENKILIYTTNVNLGSEWSKVLKPSEWKEYLKLLRCIIDNTKGPCSIFFMALDEYLLSFVLYGPLVRAITRKSKNIFIIKYRVEYLLGSCRNFKSIVLKAFTRNALFWCRGILVTFDERFLEFEFPYKVFVLPDPWFGSFSKPDRNFNRKKAGFTKQDLVLLIVGTQDERKGIPLILDSLDTIFHRIPNAKLYMVGTVKDRYIDKLNILIKKHPSRIVHVNKFISEEDLEKVFKSSDIVLLPYSLQFNSSSGVLARAAASCIPVVASCHGLVGYRVKKWGLGERFEYGNTEQFIDAIDRINRYSKARKKVLNISLYRFASYCNLESYESRLRALWHKGE